MRRRALLRCRLGVVVGAIGLAAIAAGCGTDSENSGATAEPDTVSAEEYVNRANALCADLDEALASAPSGPATFSSELAASLETFAEDLEDVEPPSELKDAHAELLSAARQEAELTRDAAEREAAGEDDVSILDDLEPAIAEAYGRGSAAAREIGLAAECYAAQE